MTDEIKNQLTDEQLDQVVDAVKKTRLPINDTEYKGTDNTDIVEASEDDKKFITGISKIDNETTTTEESETMTDDTDDVSIDNLNFDSMNEDSIKDIQSDLGLSEEDGLKLYEVIKNIKDPDYKVFKNLPFSMQETIRENAMKAGIPINQWEHIARSMIEEVASDAMIDSAFSDIEKELDEAFKLPSVVDLYTEHTKEVMDTNIPEMIESIKDTEPEKAAKLAHVREMFYKAYTFEYAKNVYENNSRIRKAVRRSKKELKSYINYFTSLNSHSGFKMPNVDEIPDTLKDLLVTNLNKITYITLEDNTKSMEFIKNILDHKYTEEDVEKFCVLILASCENMDADDPIYAAYMYYLVKNIAMLKYSNEAKTEFSLELINNICNTIEFIRTKEDEFNVSMQRKSPNNNGESICSDSVDKK